MTPYDLPPEYKVKTIEVRSFNASARPSGREQILIAIENKAAAKGTSNLVLKNHGQIAQMQMPAGWIEGEPEPYKSIRGRSFIWYHLPNTRDVKICFYARGLYVLVPSGQAFHALLQKPPHQLSEEEFKSVSEIVRDMSRLDEFEMKFAKTTDLNGKRVLEVQGHFKELNRTVRELFVDADGTTGRVVQEIFYKAPPGDYEKYAKQADAAFKSIKWKPPASAGVK